MGTGLPLILIIFSYVSFTILRSHAERIQSPHVLDLIIRDYTFNSLDKDFKTGVPQRVKLPVNLSGISVDTVRFRCGSLTRYGAQLKEFHLNVGVTVHPCIERVMLIRQNMIGYNWSSLYDSHYDLSGYKLVSPIVGLLAYNADEDYANSSSNNNNNNPFQLGIVSGENPITIDFTNIISTTKFSIELDNIKPICASFEGDGRITLAKPPNQSSPLVCIAKRNGHFGLVISETEYSVFSPPPPPQQDVELKKPIAKWKVVVGSTIGAALGAFLLGLLLVAMLARVKKRSRIVEMERRAYEEEALQVSMVGHVRAHTASGTRTTPRIENEYNIPRPSRPR